MLSDLAASLRVGAAPLFFPGAQMNWQSLSCIVDQIMTTLTLMGVMLLAEI